MIQLIRLLTRSLEIGLALPIRAVQFLLTVVVFNPRIGPLRHVVTFAFGYVAFALLLVYVMAPLRGVVGQYFMAEKLRYDAERWVAPAIYDATGSFVGTFDAKLDSLRDVNYTDSPIEIGNYIANPDHKSIPVRETPEAYWQCLSYHEDRYLGGLLNPYGIDLIGVLKIPYSTVTRSIALKRPSLGVGGSTLPMQFARVIYNTPPSAAEGAGTKLKRKLREWWLAPVIYHELTRGGDTTPLKQWAANHIWLAQRTGGQPLHGVEVTSRIVFGKEAKDLTTAEQFVLASAVNKPIILLTGNDKLNEVRMDRWRYITEVRARTCAERLVGDVAEQKKVLFELVQMASGPPDPRVRAKLQQALETYAPSLAKRAHANPVIRANALLPAARFGVREEMKQAYGHGWRDHVRGVTLTLDASANLAFHERVRKELARLDASLGGKIDPGFTLDPAKAIGDRKMPGVAVIAANHRGEIVRYFESGETAQYFGSPMARESREGRYDPTREGRHIASTGKILAAIGIANEGRDGADSLYSDSLAPERGLETCDKGAGQLTQGRKAVVSFACSLNRPLEWRAAQLGQERMRRLINGFGFNMPPSRSGEDATPPSTAAVRGLIAGSPRRVHQMAAVVLAALTEQGHRPVGPPTLVRAFDYTHHDAPSLAANPEQAIVPNRIIRREAHGLLRTLLSAPLCYRSGGQAHGTLKALAPWCAEGRGDVKLHFAKTGTSVTADPNATVDTWITGGLQFSNGAAYSYVVVVGTGSSSEPWARSVHAAQAGVPLAQLLFAELAEHAKQNPVPMVQAPRPVASTGARSSPVHGSERAEVASAAPVRAGTLPAARRDSDKRWRERIFDAQQ
jgi:membrane peptidoglycan carboxypeptidase